MDSLNAFFFKAVYLEGNAEMLLHLSRLYLAEGGEFPKRIMDTARVHQLKN